MSYFIKRFFILIFIIFNLLACQKATKISRNKNQTNEFIVELPKVAYPLPVVDYISNNCKAETKEDINNNPVVFILRGINDIWQGTTSAYQHNASISGPNKTDYVTGNPIVDSIVWRQNIQYVIERTNNRTDNQAVLAYLDDVRSKYYSVIDGFGPLTEDYVKNSGAYVELPVISVNQVLNNDHYQSAVNNGEIYAGNETLALGQVVKLARCFQNTCSSTLAPKSLYATPRPWRMNASGQVVFLGTTYDTILHQPTYLCVDQNGNKTNKIFDLYQSNVKVVPGLISTRKAHLTIYDDAHPLPTDLYSNTTENIREDNGYPSGHTNAGALISLAYAYAFPERFSELVFRGAQLGEDRIIAGMHSPVDVIGGKIMALSVACAALNKPQTAHEAELALQATADFFGTKADSLNVTLNEYAHRKIDNPTGYIVGNNVNVEVFDNNFYDNKAEIKAIYKKWLTYGFPLDSVNCGQAPVVPKGAEAILKSRFPYLTDNQRRLVLYTTEITSGYKIIDKTNGWGRINLLAAADGFGQFIGKIEINMDASLGRFNANDTWGNDISGQGCLIKDGTGTLLLTGNNSYTGDTRVNGGTLVACSNTAFGKGNVFIKNKGTLEIIQSLFIAGNLDQSAGAMVIHIGLKNGIPLTVHQQVKIHHGLLQVVFDQNLTPKKGDKFPLIAANEIKGSFEDVRVDGYQCSVKQIGNVLYLIVN